jgi:hypothetical protein
MNLKTIYKEKTDMRLTTLDEASIQAIGHAFGYYDYGKETGMGAACSSPDKTALYICGFVRAMLAAGLLYTTSERGEAFIAYRLPGEKVNLTAFFPLLKGVFQAMTFRELCRFARLMILFPIKNAPNPLPTSNTDDCIF